MRINSATFDLLKNLGPAPSVDLAIPKCSLCKKPLSYSGVKKIFTGHINAIDEVCDDCDAGLKDTSRLVCFTCRKVVARLSPVRDAKSGFQFKKNTCYHVIECVECVPNLESSQILEKACYEGEPIKQRKTSNKI